MYNKNSKWAVMQSTTHARQNHRVSLNYIIKFAIFIVCVESLAGEGCHRGLITERATADKLQELSDPEIQK
jgi:hypothetical protein